MREFKCIEINLLTQISFKKILRSLLVRNGILIKKSIPRAICCDANRTLLGNLSITNINVKKHGFQIVKYNIRTIKQIEIQNWQYFLWFTISRVIYKTNIAFMYKSQSRTFTWRRWIFCRCQVLKTQKIGGRFRVYAVLGFKGLGFWKYNAFECYLELLSI